MSVGKADGGAASKIFLAKVNNLKFTYMLTSDPDFLCLLSFIAVI